MERYQKILCATDFSDYSRFAAERAAGMARCYGAQLTLLHVVEDFPEDRSNVEIAPEDVDPMTYHEEQARASLAELAGQLGYEKVRQDVRFSEYSARHVITGYAAEQGNDLIVVASHGRYGVTSGIGSTAYGVTHSATCDVLIVRHR
jgi:universal stress protein A